jgi:hypothetical protein
VVITLPSSVLEHYDTNAEKMFNQLQKVSGRLEKIYSPVRDSEISQVIRRRLFSDVDLKECESNISEFLEYAEKEGILPARMEVSEYKEKFIDSFPFLPDVIETLYHRDPPKVEMSFVTNLAKSFSKGQPYSRRIGLTLFRNQVHTSLKNIHSHSVKGK